MTEQGKRLVEIARGLGRHQTGRLLAAAALRGLGAALLALVALLLLDRVLPDPALGGVGAWVRATGWGAVWLVPIVVFGVAVARRWPALRDLTESARRTEAESESLREQLVPALQVLSVREDRRTGYSTDLVDAFVDRTVDAVGAVRPAELGYNASVRRGAAWFGAGALAVAAILAVLRPAGFAEGLGRLTGARDWLGPRAAAMFTVSPGDVSLPRGEALDVSAEVAHAVIRKGHAEATLEWRDDAEAEWRPIALEAEAEQTREATRDVASAATFDHRFPRVNESFQYRFRHGNAASRIFDVRAMARPSLAIEEVRYRYPEYTGLPERVVQDGAGDLAAVKGTVARVLARSTNPVAEGLAEFGDSTSVALEAVDTEHVALEIPLVESGTYRLRITDELGLTNPNPLEYGIRVLSDEAPFVRLLEPGEDRDLPESMRIDLRYSAVDDYGVGRVTLVYELDRRPGEELRADLRPGSLGSREVTESFEWDLSPLDLLPGDTVSYWIEVRDNCEIDGPHTARTRSYVLRFPTLGEIFAEIEDQGQSSIDDLKDLADEAKKVEQKVEEISRETLKKGDSKWEDRQEVEQALESQQQLAEELKKIQDDIQENLERLAESEFMTDEAVQKMQQIQKLLDEVATTEMKEALEKLRAAMEEANPQRMQEQLADFQKSQDELMKQLDRVMENLKQFQMEEKLKAAVRQMEELAAQQERVNDELAQLDRGAEEETAEDSKQADSPDAGDEKAGEEKTGEEGPSPEEQAANEEAAGEEGANEEGKDADSEKSPADQKEQLADASDAEKSPEDSKSAESRSGSESEKQDGEQGESGEQSEESKSDADQSKLDQLAREEKSLSEEAKRLEQELKELAEMVQELRDSQDSQMMDGMSKQMNESQVPQTMEDMAESMEGGNQQDAKEQGEKALTELRQMLAQLSAGASMMQMRQMEISQAAINRAVRDLLSVSDDQELLAKMLGTIPRNTTSATRAFADEQYLLIRGAERVESMLEEVAKDTPLMESEIGRQLGEGLDSMRDAAYGLENGAVQMAHDDGQEAIDQVNAVVIALLRTVESMSQCSSGQPMPGGMQQLQELSQDQQRLNEALQKLRREGGQSLDHRLQAQLDQLAGEQKRIQEQLQQLLEDSQGGEGTLGRLDDVSKKLEDVARRLAEGDVSDELLRDQDWALTRLLDSQRSMRERDLGRERKSETGETLADLSSPDELPKSLEEKERDLREDLLKALDRRYPPKYEELIKQYFRSLSREGTTELP
ncbi:MAG: hypothetical protein KC591_05065 [Gemmatimonadetes bacterium]|nr:hypothetical protein [Gemmatimonadota bacterium]